MSAATDDPTGVPIPKNTTYITERQVQDWKGEVANLERMLNDPKSRIEDRGEVNRQYRKLKFDLEASAPPDTTPDQRDRLAREERELREKIQERMCSYEEMRKSPPGAVGKYRRGEASAEGKEMILRWKNIRRILHKGDDDPDVSNIELFRPRTSTLNMDNALIPGKEYFIPPATPEYKEGWDRTFGKDKEADPQEVAALQARLDELTKKLDLLSQQAESPEKKSRKTNFVETAAPCGVICKSKAGAAAHARSCRKCKDKESQEVAA